MSASISENRLSEASPRRFSAVPVCRLSTQTTRQPSAISRSQRKLPRKPAPPATNAVRLVLPRMLIFSPLIESHGDGVGVIFCCRRLDQAQKFTCPRGAGVVVQDNRSRPLRDGVAIE